MYAVATGRSPGIYKDVHTAAEAVAGSPHRAVMYFENGDDAARFMLTKRNSRTPENEILTNHLYVDGSCLQQHRESGRSVGLGIFKMYFPTAPTHVSQTITAGPKTNNFAELMAIREAVLCAETDIHPTVVWSDSQYAIKACTEYVLRWKLNGWTTSSKKPVKNKMIIADIHTRLMANPNICLRHVRGHANNLGNVMADHFAVCASKRFVGQNES
jgi:ribonuclease HI